MLYSEADTKVPNRPKVAVSNRLLPAHMSTEYGERTVTAYAPLLIWLLSAVICYYIAKARGVKPGLMWKMIVVLLGPFAIPLIFLAKAEVST